MRQILGALPLCREIRAHAPRVLVQRVAGLKRRLSAPLSVRAAPVVELALLDLCSTPLGESPDVRRIHPGPVYPERLPSPPPMEPHIRRRRPSRAPGAGRRRAASAYFSSQPNSMCFVVSRATCAIESTSGISFGQTSTQFCDLPQSVMPPSPITDSSRSFCFIAPEGCML